MNDLYAIALGDIDLGIIEDIDLGDLFADFALGDLSGDFALPILDDLTMEWDSFKFSFDFPDLGGVDQNPATAKP